MPGKPLWKLAPEVIYLQWFDDFGNEREHSEDITWCHTEIASSDVRYLRSDVVSELFDMMFALTLEGYEVSEQENGVQVVKKDLQNAPTIPASEVHQYALEAVREAFENMEDYNRSHEEGNQQAEESHD